MNLRTIKVTLRHYTGWHEVLAWHNLNFFRSTAVVREIRMAGRGIGIHDDTL